MADEAARDREALREATDELLELEGERDFKQAILESLETAPDSSQTEPDSRKAAHHDFDLAVKKVNEKKAQKRLLELRVRAAKSARNNASSSSTASASRDTDKNMWSSTNNHGWGQASVPYRMPVPTSTRPTQQSVSGSAWNPSAFGVSAQPSYASADPMSFGGVELGRTTPLNSGKRSWEPVSESYGLSTGRNKYQRTDNALADIIDLTGDDDDVNTSISRSREKDMRARGDAFNSWGVHRADPTSMVAPYGPGSSSFATHQFVDNNSLTSSWPVGPVPTLEDYMPTFGNTSSSTTPLSGADGMPTMPGSYLSDEDDLDIYNNPFVPGGRLHDAFGAPPHFPPPLTTAEVINRTRNFDFMGMTDRQGNPLDPRVASIMEDIADDPRKSREEVEALLKNVQAGMEIPEEDREGTPDDMRYPLYNHQRVALTWMKRQEKGTNKGGILADDMGLGKTISVLSLVVAHKSDKDPKTTLIVAPLSLIRQWESEIKKKIKPDRPLSVFVFHNTQKISARELMKYDVVLTTYGTLSSDKKKLDLFWKDNGARQVNTKTDTALASSVSFFHPDYSSFYRVVLDESQMIKNRNAQAAVACAALKSKYRWCLSGTPMMNGVDELFSLYRYLHIKPYNEWSRFRNAFGVLFGKNGDAKSQAMRNLQVLLKATLLRRTKTSEIDGKPILQLPEKTEEIVYAELDADEREFYTDLETKSQVQINKYLRKGTLGKHYSHVLVLLLRMRQSCCHPHLLLDSDDALPEVDDNMLNRAKTLSSHVVNRIMEKSRAIETAGTNPIGEGFECPICYDMMPDPTIPLPCGHELCATCLKQHVDNAKRDNIRNGEENGQVRCAVCRGPLDPRNIITLAAFKKVHMPDEVSGSSEEDDSDGSVWSSDGEDETEDVDSNGNIRDFVVEDDEEEDEKNEKQNDIYDLSGDSSSESSESAKKSKPKPQTPRKKKGKQKATSPSKEATKRLKKIKGSMLHSLRKDAKKNATAWKDYTKYLRHHWLSSAKARACVDLIRKIQESGEKTIVFSQWTMLLDLLEVALKKDDLKIQHCRYTGEMSMSQRDDAAYRFTTDPNMKVMFVSLRAGNAGLNLVAASRVIIMDPFWNPYIEMQAIDRAHRIGQQKPVQVYRILTRETVEDRIIQLQEKKRATVDAALDEREGAKLAGLSLGELRFLFDL